MLKWFWRAKNLSVYKEAAIESHLLHCKTSKKMQKGWTRWQFGCSSSLGRRWVWAWRWTSCILNLWQGPSVDRHILNPFLLSFSMFFKWFLFIHGSECSITRYRPVFNTTQLEPGNDIIQPGKHVYNTYDWCWKTSQNQKHISSYMGQTVDVYENITNKCWHSVTIISKTFPTLLYSFLFIITSTWSPVNLNAKPSFSSIQWWSWIKSLPNQISSEYVNTYMWLSRITLVTMFTLSSWDALPYFLKTSFKAFWILSCIFDALYSSVAEENALEFFCWCRMNECFAIRMISIFYKINNMYIICQVCRTYQHQLEKSVSM